jgi:FkbM family methyltransferase
MKEKNFKLIDVGANVGIYSVIFAKEVQKISMAELLPNGPDHKNRADKEVSKKKGGAVVFAFEPDPRNLSRFYRNIALNIDRPELIFVSEFGISDEKKRSKFNLSKFGGTSGIESYGKEPNFEIEVDTLDRFCTGLISPQENLILKVDVEGHESAVLRGALNTLKANRPIVFIEVFPQSSNLDFDLMDEILLLYTHAEYVSGSKTQCFKDLNSNQLRSFKKYGNLILYNK